MRRIIIVGLLVLDACTKTETGQRQVDYQAIQNGALVACAVAPTAEQIAALYTSDPNVQKTEQAVAILCAALAAKVVQPAPSK